MTKADQGGWNPPLTQEEVAAAFEALSPKERELFCLVQAEGLSHEQAAKRCGVSVKRFQRRLARILGRIRRKIERARGRRR
jgi:RNA polymerase sigma factor (sigma-70 family)